MVSRFLPLKRQSSEEAFTLIELMIVVVIIDILAAIAIPVFSKYMEKHSITDRTRVAWESGYTYQGISVKSLVTQNLCKPWGPTA